MRFFGKVSDFSGTLGDSINARVITFLQVLAKIYGIDSKEFIEGMREALSDCIDLDLVELHIPGATRRHG